VNTKLDEKVKSYSNRRKKTSLWKKIVSVLACVVVFCTTYALILPAITQEQQTFCGVETHTHGETCYKEVLNPENSLYSCSYQSLQVHTHTPECYDSKGRVLCNQADYLIHIHDFNCYNEKGELICQLPERVQHIHTENCYDVDTEHVHSESCYSYIKGDLICLIPEILPHVHSDECYVWGDNYVCNSGDAHIHSDKCYIKGENIICLFEEGHIHTEECYSNGVLTCEKQENHIHKDSCFESILNCAETENGHIHSDSCKERVLICSEDNSESHVHSDSCYAWEKVLDCSEDKILICTEPEAQLHLHGENCPKKAEDIILTCTLEENENHSHNKLCYGVWELSCEKAEHTHSLICYSDITADVENSDIWEKSLADVKLTNVWSEDLLNIARSQLGYNESLRNYTVLEDGETKKGYTRYGEWYGIEYGDWCAMFVSFCLNYANIESRFIPYAAGCCSWINELEKLDMFKTPDEYSPKAGDIIFFDWDKDGYSDHVGIVEKTEENIITTIEGNSSDTVKRNEYEVSSTSISGYGILPVNLNLAEREIIADIYVNGEYGALAEDSTVIKIRGQLPENAAAKAYKVFLDEDLIMGKTLLTAYDITVFDSFGNIYEPETPLSVSIEVPNEISINENQGEFSVYYVPDEGTPREVNTEKLEDEVSFTADHFSVYALTLSGTLDTVYLDGTNGDDQNGGTASNSAVKTVNKALKLIKKGGTVYVSGTIEIKEDFELDVSGEVTFERSSSFTGPLFKVSAGAEFKAGSVTIHGGNTSERVKAKAPLIVAEEKSCLILNEGAILTANSNVTEITIGEFEENSYVGLGGAVYVKGGKLIMLGGSISNCEAIYGGGVCLADNAEMVMLAGSVNNNFSFAEGGGISLYRTDTAESEKGGYYSKLTLGGGEITDNKAGLNGGGISIGEGCGAFINAGIIENNTAGVESGVNSAESSEELTSKEGYGGGIYVACKKSEDTGETEYIKGKLVINSALITENTASVKGGGLALGECSECCIYGGEDSDKGSLIFANKANDNINELYKAGVCEITNKTFLGLDYNWNEAYSENAFSYISKEDYNALADIQSLIKVVIKNNKADFGGGIAGEGLIEIGGEKRETTYINIQNILSDDKISLHPEYIEVNILQDGENYGDPIRIYPVKDENGNEIWKDYYVGGLPKDYIYSFSVSKIEGYNTEIKQNGNSLYLTSTPEGFEMQIIWENEDSVLPDFVTVQLLRNGEAYGDAVEINAEKNWKHIWYDLAEFSSMGEAYVYSVIETDIPEGYYVKCQTDEKGVYIIKNSKIPLITVSAEAKWDEENLTSESMELVLLKNGNLYGEKVILNSENGMTYKWENLPKFTKNAEAIEYTLDRIEVIGYETLVETTVLTDDEGNILSDVHFVITNTKNINVLPVNFTVYSKDSQSGSKVPVSGAHLSLYIFDEENGALIPGTQNSGILLESWVSENAAAESKGSHLTELEDGTYYLVETAAPSGHIGLDDAVIFTVDSVNEKIILESVNVNGGTELQKNENGVFDLSIYNAAAYTLPKTGGSGTYGYYITGAICVVFAGLILFKKSRKEEKFSP